MNKIKKIIKNSFGSGYSIYLTSTYDKLNNCIYVDLKNHTIVSFNHLVQKFINDLIANKIKHSVKNGIVTVNL